MTNAPSSDRPEGDGLCEDCPPVGYPTDRTRCAPCPRRATDAAEGAGEAREIVTEWLGMFDPPPQIDFQQSEFLQQAIATALGKARTSAPPQPAPDAMREKVRLLAQKIRTSDIEQMGPARFIVLTLLVPEHDVDDFASALSSAPVTGDRTAINNAADEVVRRVAEYDDRTSPEDFPEALLITPSELHNELTRFADALSLRVQPGAGERESAIKFCITVVEEECVLDARPDDSEYERAVHNIGLVIRDRLNCAIRNPDARQAPHSSDETES